MKYFNNPLNIRCGSKWLGLCGTKNGFCKFKHIRFCIRAGLILILKNYPKHGALTISEVINRWAPASDNNNTSLYIDYVCASSCLNDNAIVRNLNFDQLYLIFKAMCWMESHTFLSRRTFYEAYYIYII